MTEYPDTDSKQKFLAMTADISSGFTFKVCLENSGIIEYKPQKDYSGSVSIIVSTPELSENNEYTLYIDDTESGVYKANEIPAGSFGGGRGGGFNKKGMTPPEDFNPENMIPPEGFDGNMPPEPPNDSDKNDLI